MNPQEAKKLEDKISNTLDKSLKSTKPIVLGISGGPDSMLLLTSVLNFFQNKNSKTPKKIIIAHVNHNLRGKESKADEDFVNNYVKTLQAQLKSTKNTSFELFFYSKSAQVKVISLQSKQNLEETARKTRYNFFSKLAEKNKAKLILTAHHADDNLETILLNLTRGASLQGLCGMQETDSLPYSKKGELHLLRPLLQVSKKEIISYLNLKKIPYRIDKSNFSNDLNRNLIRNKVVPELKKINPNIAQTTAKNTSNLKEINDFLKQKALLWISANSKKGPSNAKTINLPAKNFRHLNPALQKQIILESHESLIGNTKNIETTHLKEALNLINQNIGNKEKKLGKTNIKIKNNIITIKSSK
jgi:tRNA(Ile)-lysidine synthase